MPNPKALKEIVGNNNELEQKISDFINSDVDWSKYTECLKLIEECCKWRNEKIEAYCKSYLENFPTETQMEMHTPFILYYADENTIDDLGKLILELIKKYSSEN